MDDVYTWAIPPAFRVASCEALQMQHKIPIRVIHPDGGIRLELRPVEDIVGGLQAERSRRTGRLRAMVREGHPEFVVGTDGLPRPTFRGGARLHEYLTHGRERVVVHDDAVPFVREGRSLFSTFALRADPALVPGASALLVDDGDHYLGVGRLLLAPHEMGRLRRGVAVRVTAHAHSRPVGPEE